MIRTSDTKTEAPSGQQFFDQVAQNREQMSAVKKFFGRYGEGRLLGGQQYAEFAAKLLRQAEDRRSNAIRGAERAADSSAGLRVEAAAERREDTRHKEALRKERLAAPKSPPDPRKWYR